MLPTTAETWELYSTYLLSTISLLAISIVLLCKSIFVSTINSKNARQFDKMADMSNKHPIFGHLLHFKNIGNKLMDFLHEESLKNRTYMCTLPFSAPIMFTSDPAVNQRILSTGFNQGLYQKPKIGTRQLKELLGTGIFLTDGKAWQKHRNIATPLFQRARIQSYVPLFVDNALKLIEIFKQKAAAGESVDIQHYFFRYTLDSFCEIGFGVQLNAMGGSEDAEKFFHAFEYISDHTEWRMKTGELWRIKEFFLKDKKFVAHVDFVDTFIFNIIKQRRELSKEELAEKKDLLSQLISMEGENFTDKELRDWIMNLIIAGRDTTAITLTWTIYELSQGKNIEIVDKLIGEMSGLLEISPEEMNSTTFTPEFITEKFTYEFQKKQRFLHKIFQETLRLYPPIPINAFETVCDDVITTSDNKTHLLKKGTICIYSAWTSQRNPDSFEDPLKYNPDRFDKPVKPFSFLAFNAGPRICLGQEMAYVEAKILLSCLLSQFDFEIKNIENVVAKQSIILTAINGLHVNIKPKRNDFVN